MDIEKVKEYTVNKGKQSIGFIKENWKPLLLLGTALVVTAYLTSDDDEKATYIDDDFEYIPPLNNYEKTSSLAMDIEPIKPKSRSIGGLDATGSRFKDNEKEFLEKFSENRDRFNGIEYTSKSEHTGWSSDGKYTRWTETTHRFEEGQVGVTVDSNYRDDDGQSSEETYKLDKARDVVDYFKANKNNPAFSDVQDITGLL